MLPSTVSSVSVMDSRWCWLIELRAAHNFMIYNGATLTDTNAYVASKHIHIFSKLISQFCYQLPSL